MASELHPAPVASPTRQRVAAWIALALALVYPLTVAWIAFTLSTQSLNEGSTLAILFQSFYMGIICLAWPLPIIAAYLATLVVMDARDGAPIAWAAIVISALTLLVIASVVFALVFFTDFL